MLDQRWLARSACALIVALLSVPGGAEAQAWLSDRSRAEGPGFRLGDFELHPGVGVEVGYDSNLYYSSDDAPDSLRRDSGILRASAHLYVSTRGQQRREEGEAGGTGDGAAPQPVVTFRGGLSGSFYAFFNDIDRTNMEADASLALGILPGRPFSINISNDFGRTVRPFTENTSATASYGRIHNDASLQLNFATTGEVLKITAGYQFGLNVFEEGQFAYGNRFQHRLTLREQFRFLPQTAIFHETNVTFLDYFDDSAIAGAPTLVNDGILVSTRLGINGALTQNFSVLASVGYSAGFFDSRTPGTYDVEYESLAAQVQARWAIAENTRLTFGYSRDFQPSYVGNFYRYDRGEIAFQTLVDRVFLLGAEASFGYYEFGAAVGPDGVTPVGSTLGRGDFRLITSIFAEYRFTDWLGINATLRYTGNYTDYAYQIGTTTGPIVDPAGFNKFEAWFGVRVFY